MAKLYQQISPKLQQFIEDQKIFFVATATADSRINLSPKGMDSLRILDPNRVAWLNVTGSGNETAAHVQENPRMTLMFTAFEDNPLILRLYWHRKDYPQRRSRMAATLPTIHPRFPAQDKSLISPLISCKPRAEWLYRFITTSVKENN